MVLKLAEAHYQLRYGSSMSPIPNSFLDLADFRSKKVLDFCAQIQALACCAYHITVCTSFTDNPKADQYSQINLKLIDCNDNDSHLLWTNFVKFLESKSNWPLGLKCITGALCMICELSCGINGSTIIYILKTSLERN